MNTDKLNTIDEDALDHVAGGSLVGAVGELVDAGVGLHKSNFESGLKFAQEQLSAWETYVGKVRKALFGA